MKNFGKLLLIFLILSSIQCSKTDTQQKCDFIGKWCTYNPNVDGCLLGVELEFRENGELYQFGSSFFTWESEDCKTIDIINNGTGEKSAEYKVISLVDNILTLDIGIGPTQYIRVE